MVVQDGVMRHFVRYVWLLLAGVQAWATPIEATFTGVNGTQAFGYYVGPYYGKLDQQFVV